MRGGKTIADGSRAYRRFSAALVSSIFLMVRRMRHLEREGGGSLQIEAFNAVVEERRRT